MQVLGLNNKKNFSVDTAQLAMCNGSFTEENVICTQEKNIAKYLRYLPQID
jgi:hypothetical protein